MLGVREVYHAPAGRLVRHEFWMVRTAPVAWLSHGRGLVRLLAVADLFARGKPLLRCLSCGSRASKIGPRIRHLEEHSPMLGRFCCARQHSALIGAFLVVKHLIHCFTEACHVLRLVEAYKMPRV
jgi:hypothetical protein